MWGSQCARRIEREKERLPAEHHHCCTGMKSTDHSLSPVGEIGKQPLNYPRWSSKVLEPIKDLWAWDSIKSAAKIHKKTLFVPSSRHQVNVVVCARRPTASKVLLAFLYANWFWSLDFSIKGCIWLRTKRSHILSSAGVVAIGRNLYGTWPDCCFLGSGVMWISLHNRQISHKNEVDDIFSGQLLSIAGTWVGNCMRVNARHGIRHLQIAGKGTIHNRVHLCWIHNLLKIWLCLRHVKACKQLQTFRTGELSGSARRGGLTSLKTPAEVVCCREGHIVP